MLHKEADLNSNKTYKQIENQELQKQFQFNTNKSSFQQQKILETNKTIEHYIVLHSRAHQKPYMDQISQQQKANIRNSKVNDIRSRLKQNNLLNQRKNHILQKLQKCTLEQEAKNQITDNNGMSCSFFDFEKLNPERKNSHGLGKSFEQNYRILQKIGEGAHGVVKKCVSLKSGKEYAVKILKMDDQQITYLKKNFINIESLDHPCVIKYKGMYFEQKKSTCYLLMEYFSFPNLLEIEIQSLEELKKITKQIIETLVYLHRNKICHRDIKPQNILYDRASNLIKIIDFGISKYVIERGYTVDMFTNTGTLYYKAPQMFLGGGYDVKVDMWALGVTIYKIVAKKTPFESTYHNETIKNIIKADALFKDQIWQKYGFAKDFVQRLLKPSSKRLSAEQAKNHIWFDFSLIWGQTDMINSMFLLDPGDLVKLNSVEDFLMNKSENMKCEKKGDLKKEMKMLDWLNEDFEGVDLTDSLQLN